MVTDPVEVAPNVPWVAASDSTGAKIVLPTNAATIIELLRLLPNLLKIIPTQY
jgi:hypothetical protein